MVRVLSLLWTLIASIGITSLSFYYVRADNGEVSHGFPFSFAKETVNRFGEITLSFNYVSIVIDVIIWWLLFSVLWIFIRNYIFEAD